MASFLRSLFLITVVAALASSCEKETAKIDPQHNYTAYFPLQPGHYVTYDVDSTYWDDFLCVKTVHTMQLRYSVADTFTDNQDRPSYRIEIYIRKSDSLPWQNHQVIYVTPTAERLEYVQNNLRFIKLIFPISEGSTWNGNRFISAADQDFQYFGDWIYKYSNVGQAFDTERKYYDNTVTVSGIDYALNNPEEAPADYAERTYAKEVYAKDAGLVFREMTRWVYDPNVKRCRKGYSVTMRAVDNN